MPLLTVTVSENKYGVVTISPAGSIDSDTYAILEKDVDAVFESDPKALVFDMKDVKYISSMGIRTILTAKNRIEEADGSLVMINLQPQIRKVIDIVKAIPRHNMFENRQELDRYLSIIQRKEIEGGSAE